MSIVKNRHVCIERIRKKGVNIVGNEKTCYYSEKHKKYIHVFKPDKCRCVCGKRIVRQPVKENKQFLFGESLNER